VRLQEEARDGEAVSMGSIGEFLPRPRASTRGGVAQVGERAGGA
jgi:hypothetical protein